MENNDPYEELEIYLKQINVSTTQLTACPSKTQQKAEEISFISISFSRAFSSPIDRLFCQSQKHIIMHKKTDFCYRMNSIPFMIDSANILYYGLSSFISYFNHDRLIALCFLWLVRLQAPHATQLCDSHRNEFVFCVDPAISRTWNWIEVYWLICTFNVFNCPLCLSGNARNETFFALSATNKHDQTAGEMKTLVAFCELLLWCCNVVNLVNNYHFQCFVLRSYIFTIINFSFTSLQKFSCGFTGGCYTKPPKKSWSVAVQSDLSEENQFPPFITTTSIWSSPKQISHS